MLDEDKLFARYRDLVKAEMHDRDLALADAFREIRSDMARRGLTASSIAVHQYRKAAEAELRTRSLLIWGALTRVHVMLGRERAVSLAEKFMREVTAQLDEQVRQLEGGLEQVLPTGLGSFTPESAKSLADARSGALVRLGAEIDLYVDSLEAAGNAASASGQPVFNISGGVGAIQTGAGAVAHVAQDFDKEVLLHALTLVSQQIATAASTAPAVRSEIEDLVIESRQELQKPTPSLIKVRGLLTGIATTIQTMGSMQQAYQALKAGLVMLGISLQ
jgi:hypothetical protein